MEEVLSQLASDKAIWKANFQQQAKLANLLFWLQAWQFRFIKNK